MELRAEEGGAVVLLEMSASLLASSGARPGDRVRVSGTILAKAFGSRVSFRLDVLGIDLEEDGPPAVRRAEASLTALLRDLPRPARVLPDRVPLRLVLLRPKSEEAQVHRDFLNRLVAVRPAIEVREVPVSMHDAVVLARAIRAARGDVLAVVRGGGSDHAFAVFETPDVLQALAASPCFRILGLGHAGNRTLADLLVEVAADTPSDAGAILATLVQGRLQVARAPTDAPGTAGRPQAGLRPVLWVGVILMLIIGVAAALRWL